MIGFSLTYSERKLERIFQAQMKVPLLYQPYFYQSSEVFPDLYCIPSESPNEIFPMELGLVPGYIEEIDDYRIENTESTSIKLSDLNNNCKRCLILATGLVIPTFDYTLEKMIPLFYHAPNKEVFSIAGVYDEIKPDYYTAAFVKNGTLPLILEKKHEYRYLQGDLDFADISVLLASLSSYKLSPCIYYKDGFLNKAETLNKWRD